MISRRNIRVKVMQTIYAVSALEKDIQLKESAKILQNYFNDSRSLLVYLTWFLTEVARYAETYSHNKASKHLPTAEDLSINTKIAGNELLWKVLNDTAFQEQLKKEKPELRSDKELIRKLYLLLAGAPEYKEYIATPGRDKNDEKKIIEFILNDILLPNEAFLAHIEEIFLNWDNDGEMVVQLLAGYLHKPGSYDFNQMVSPDKAVFASSLLQTVLEKNEFLQELIIPKLRNWDPDRIAHLDMIMMKMGVAEFLFFETIPPKVTINEYIDLAKDYSTQQSGQFVNGILDNIHKELVQQGKMQKVDYKKA